MNRPVSSDAAAEGRIPVWDAHTHCYPREVARDPVGWARDQGERHWAELVTQGPQGWADPEEMLRAMDTAGIERALLLGWYWERADTARLQNEWHATWVDKHPGRFLAAMAVHPEMSGLSERLQEGLDWGAVLCGECLPEVQAPEGWEHPGWEEILHFSSERGWPLSLHVTEPAGHCYPGRVETPFEPLLRVFECHPRQKWLLAHWGGGLPFYGLNPRVARALSNVWFDSAATPLLYRKEVWRIIHQLVGPERMVFGSDFPLLLGPRGRKEPDWSRILDQVAAAGFSAADLEAILNGNLRDLLQLPR